MSYNAYHSIVHDYAVLLFGSAFFKMIRLIFCAVLVVHMFSCGFYRVKVLELERESRVRGGESRKEKDGE
jgi:hypothetical protein